MPLGCSANSSIVRSMSAIVFMGVALAAGLMPTGEIGTLVFIISAFLTFAFVLAWASQRGG
jgi:hypothetical protein